MLSQSQKNVESTLAAFTQANSQLQEAFVQFAQREGKQNESPY